MNYDYYEFWRIYVFTFITDAQHVLCHAQLHYMDVNVSVLLQSSVFSPESVIDFGFGAFR